ncbi:MAG: hypothetical protein LBT51_02020 [Fusobacteriaceae bacterium]|jgi:hypothetical protein|nr:hypothetical protein [Fusobacteriaceae bacterium]
MDNKTKFIEIYNENIKREGADKLLEYLCSSHSDFFTSPSSARFHGSFPGGLVEHSLNVYECLNDYLLRPTTKDKYKMNYSQESIAITSLLHDVCKINCYKESSRNVKDEFGVWQKVPYYEFDDPIPYGHGEKSVYIISGYMKLKREEAFAIRYHMGFSGIEDKKSIGTAFKQYPLAFALSVADMEATYYLE